jgi:hypothetical protein
MRNHFAASFIDLNSIFHCESAPYHFLSFMPESYFHYIPFYRKKQVFSNLFLKNCFEEKQFIFFHSGEKRILDKAGFFIK